MNIKQLADIIFTLYVYASIIGLYLAGLVFMALALLGMFSPEILPWVFRDWYIGFLLIVVATALTIAAQEEEPAQNTVEVQA
jgi:hypothetical protein